MIRRETRQIAWSRSATFRPFDGSGKNIDPPNIINQSSK